MVKAPLLALAAVLVLSLAPLASAQGTVQGEASRTFPSIADAVPRTITENVLSAAGTPVFEVRVVVSNVVVQGIITL
jgi:hypothetical protein